MAAKKTAPSPRTSHHPTLESRMTRMEDGIENLNVTVGNFIASSTENQEHRAKWESSVEGKLISSSRPSWGTFAAIIPIIVVAATWISSYVGGISAKHSATEDRIRIESELEDRYATKERRNLEDRITRREADAVRKETYLRIWMDSKIASDATTAERINSLHIP